MRSRAANINWATNVALGKAGAGWNCRKRVVEMLDVRMRDRQELVALGSDGSNGSQGGARLVSYRHIAKGVGLRTDGSNLLDFVPSQLSLFTWGSTCGFLITYCSCL